MNNEYIPIHLHEADLDRSDRHAKRWFIAWLITFVLLISSVAGFFIYESQFETITEKTEWDIDQNADDGGSNRFVGGDYYGTAEDPGN